MGIDVRDAKKIAVMVFENMMKGFFWIGEYEGEWVVGWVCVREGGNAG